MRYLAGALFLASCTALTPSPVDNAAIDPRAPAATPPAADAEQETRKARSRTPVPPPPEISSCANLNKGDVKETIRAKLDCISENAK
jgi:hypothetical protein